MENPIPVIDIFAGPGGLGEGFSAAKSKNNHNLFQIKISIEKDLHAHKTLELRAFFRQFTEKKVPVEYYEYLQGSITREELFSKYKIEAELAKNEACLATLGETPENWVDNKIKNALGETSNWVLIGGPPCQAYSLVGRSRMRGENEEKYEKDPRHFLYKEYLRIIAIHKPPIFVMENVKGLLSSQINQQKTFDLILSDLRNPPKAVGDDSQQKLSYVLFSVSKKRPNDIGKVNHEDFIVRSEEYGIPQARHRLIILGIRADFYNSDPEILQKQTPAFIEDVLNDLPKLRSGVSKEEDSVSLWYKIIQEIKFANWANSLPEQLREKMNTIFVNIDTNLSRGKTFIPTTSKPKRHKDWYGDPNLNGVCNHETRSHIREDLYRYFFAALFASENGYSPKLSDFPDELLPKHGNIQDALTGSKFNDRFRVQVQRRPSTTVVSHISKDGHYYIHYDPAQCRSLTVREAARLQTFPDNYLFEGPRTEQYHQVGNAVPPMLAHQIAQIVAKLFENQKSN